MKRILITGLLALLAGATTLFAQNMNDGHQLTHLWKEYEKAQKADLPQKEADALARIKEEAMARHLPEDFFDAATAYVNTVQRRDWKQRESLRENLEKEMAAFKEPIVTFLWMANWKSASSTDLWNYVRENADGFKGSHPALQRGVDGFLNGSLKPFIRTDKEYALWYLVGRNYDTDAPQYKALEAEVAGVYPNEAVLEYFKLGRQNWTAQEHAKEKEAYESLARKYAGKPFSVYPRAQVLRIRYDELIEAKAGQEQYKALYQDAATLEKERKGYTGDAKTLVTGCNYQTGLMETLTGRDLSVQFKDGKALVLFRNLKNATVTLREEKKTLKTWNAVNSAASFFVQDTVLLDLPVLPDGEYTLEAKNGKISAEDVYTQYTLSIATRMDSRGRCVYVTDYKTGVPLRSVTLRLSKSGKEIATSTLKLDGFTPLPSAFVKQLEGSTATWNVVAESGNRKSRSIILDRTGKWGAREYNDQVRCNIYKDRGAYNPGDTVQFKAIVYKGDPAQGLKVQKGRKVKMILRDSEDNVLETQELTTNDWGAVSGSFALPVGLRNGGFELEAEGLGYDWFRVDEFVLPTFDLNFDPVTQLYLVGDDVPVSGSLVSYSGHNLSGARIRVKVSCYGTDVFDQEVPIGESNSFKTVFPAKEEGYYHVNVTVTEATGETHDFNTGLFIGESLDVEATVHGAADTDLAVNDLKGENQPYAWRSYWPRHVVESQAFKVTLQARDASGNNVPLPVNYELSDASGKSIVSGETASGEVLSLKVPADGMYQLKATVSAQNAQGKTVSQNESFYIFSLTPASRTLCPEVKRVFIAGSRNVAAKGAVTARMGTTEGDTWAVVTLYGEKRQVLVHQSVHVKNGSLENLSFPYKDTYPDAVRLQVFYFINGSSVQYNREYRRAKDKYSLPLEFTRFQDKAYPGTEYSFTVKTAPGAEVLVAAWDKSIDAIEENDWPLVNTRDFSVEGVNVSSACGMVGGDRRSVFYVASAGMTRAKSVGNMAVMEEAEYAVADDAIAFQMVEQKPAFGGSPEPVNIREKFSSALTFQPHLRPAKDGTLTFRFSTSDKLSTYYVRVYAHDQQMHNAMDEEEMVVSIPVKVSVLEPRYLYVGDNYNAAVSLSSVADKDISGTLSLQVGSTVQQVSVTVPAGKTVTRYFPVEVTEESVAPEGASAINLATEGGHLSEVTLTAAFRAKEFSDAIRVHVPVYAASQQLTEAHSAVLRAGMDREALLADLRARFVNVPGSAATLKDISVLDMVKDAIPSHVDPKNNDVLSLSEAWYVRLMAARLNGDGRVSAEEGVQPEGVDNLLEKILACRNADGGFGWFEGMKSSPVITAVLLERFAALRDRGFEVPDMTSSVKFLDRNQFGTVQPYWCGWISDEKYMHVRAMYASVPFEEKAVSEAGKKRFSQFAKDAKSYLMPSRKDGRGLQGQILAKARRLLTLRNLQEREGGLALAKAWGLSLWTSAKLKKSIKADTASLLEYAVEHRDGGWYYPNAVMPWRGLLESEAYAHALLCNLLSASLENNAPSVAKKMADAPSGASSSEVANGIRLWLMLQKETQKWDAEPEFIDAITAILDGPDAVLNTRVLALSASYEAPLDQIKASGNGFTVERKFYREGVEIKPGDAVQVGDRITVKYNIWNGENRSFVKVRAGREASLSPVQQLSGHIGYGFIVPFRSGVVWGFTPQGYRNVKAAATEYYFDSYPEEKTTLSEEFYVVRAGTFVAPVTVIESLYAPHYRANSASLPPLRSFVDDGVKH